MINEVQSSKEVLKIEMAINKIKKEMPSLETFVDAFREILIGRAILKAQISDMVGINISSPDPLRFSQGEPLFTEEVISSLVDPWGESVNMIIPPLAKGFPKIKPELMRLKSALETGEIDLSLCIEAFVRNQEEKIDRIASRLEIQPSILRFMLGQILKPFIEKRSEKFQLLTKNLTWYKGYCPTCGSFPELSFLKGDEGQRFLRCAFCGHEWRFKRNVCPFCENEDHEKIELKFLEGSEHEWVELCYKCHKYVVNIDLRKCSDEVATEVAALGMLPLDIIAQKKGFSPVASCAWNIVVKND